MEWEEIDGQHHRTKVFGGWLVKAFEDVTHADFQTSETQEGWDWRVAMTFVPDPKHEWDVKSK